MIGLVHRMLPGGARLVFPCSSVVEPTVSQLAAEYAPAAQGVPGKLFIAFP